MAGWAGPLILGLGFFGVALAPVADRYAVVDAGLLLVVYLLLGTALYHGAAAAMRLARPLGLLAALAIGVLALWHLREQTDRPAGLAAFAAASVAVAAPISLALWRLASGRAMRSLALSLAAGLALIACVAGLFAASDSFRWFLLRHNRLLGTPAYYALAEPVDAVRQELWTEGQARSSRAAIRGLPPGPEPLPEATPPHIVFLMIDTLRADGLAAYGGDPSHMPGINARAQGWTVFEDVVANSSWTRPSVASIFTGLHTEEHGAVDREDRLPAHHRTLAEGLADRGYTSAAFVSNFGAVGRDAGFDQGFEHFEEILGRGAPYARAEVVGEHVRLFLREQPLSTPLFLYVHFLDPHTPYLSGGSARHHAEARRAYAAELRYLDGELSGLLSDLLAELGDETWVLLTSDHGEEFGEHQERGHGKSLYREVVWLPLLVRAPGREAARIDSRLEARDVFDLVTRIADSPELDLRRWAEEHHRERRYSSLYTTTGFALHRPYRQAVGMRAVEQDGHWLIWSAYGPTYELYDAEGDPQQHRNLVRARPRRVEALSGSLDASLRYWARREPVDLGERTLDQLRALGYIEP